MQIHDGMLTKNRLQKLEFHFVCVEAVFGEDRWTEGVAEDVEVLFEVGVIVGDVGAEPHAREVFGCGGVE